LIQIKDALTEYCHCLGLVTHRDAQVYVVEGDVALRSSIKFALNAEGLTVQEYADARSFLEHADFSVLSCAVVDYNLADMTGLELIVILRKHANKIPVILTVSIPTPDIHKDAAVLNVAVVEKPFLGGHLVDAIRSALAHLPPDF
jgi:FixJ family two-component response regulator